MLKFFFFLVTLFGAAIGGWWITTNHPEFVSKVETLIRKGDLHTLELRFGANQIMDAHKKELLKDKHHQFLEPSIIFYPYLLMEVKYSVYDHLTGEGVILWDLIDGEMVTNTRDWDKTHGFSDCLKSRATREEFKIINILARHPGSVDRDVLCKTLRVENEILDAWVDSCRRKKLIVQSGNKYRLHLRRPRFNIIPETKLDKTLVTQAMKKDQCLHAHFSSSQIIRMTKAAFGDSFSIRKTTLVYLPVHRIPIKNPDGSIHTSHWNALNGRLLDQARFIE